VILSLNILLAFVLDMYGNVAGIEREKQKINIKRKEKN